MFFSPWDVLRQVMAYGLWVRKFGLIIGIGNCLFGLFTLLHMDSKIPYMSTE